MSTDLNNNIPEFELKSDKLEEINFKVEVLEENVGYDPHLPHRHDYFEIFFFIQGGGLHVIDFEEIEIRKEEIHVLSPGQIHYMRRDAVSSGIVIKFNEAFYLSLLNDKETLKRIPFFSEHITNPVFTPSPPEFNDLLLLVNRIEKEYAQKNMGFRSMIHNYLNVILMTFQRFSTSSPALLESNEGMLYNKFMKQLEASFIHQHKSGFYSDELNISQDKLTAAVKRVTGKLPNDIITKRLVLEAKRLLLHSNMSVKEIAYHLNFQDNAYFNRWFKKLENISPGGFRVESREKYHT